MAISAQWQDVKFKVGDTIKIQHRIKEGGKERLVAFLGVVIAIKGRGENKMFTARRMGAQGVWVEQIFPLSLPLIAKIEVKKKATKVRRAKLYYLRKTS
ncbi:50S ribosomal protein L19 [Candidatus Shapirobacteria bacterium]|nr:50S ribosomal protein L19 [Candidatus Shapirobacteria bacterium]